MTAGLTHSLRNEALADGFLRGNKGLAGQMLVNLFLLAILPVQAQLGVVSISVESLGLAPGNSIIEQTMVPNQPPIANFTFTPTRPLRNYPLTFNATGSGDPDGTIVSYFWNWGDGTTNTTTTPVIIHSYDDSDTFTATLTVTDNGQLTASANSSLTTISFSSNRFPIANFTVSPSTAFPGDMLRFNGTGSIDPDGQVSSYLWLFGDGKYQKEGSIALHSYSSPGHYLVTLLVTDSSGVLTSAYQKVDILEGLTLSISVDKTEGAAPLHVSLNAEALGGKGPYIFSWSFGDGEIALGETHQHDYLLPDSYHVEVRVADSAGNIAYEDIIITVISSPDIAGESEGEFGFGPVSALYAVNGIAISGVGLTVLLAAYPFMVRRSRRDPTATWDQIAHRNRRGSSSVELKDR